MQLEKVQKYLRKELAPKTNEEILEATGVDIDSNDQIVHSLSADASKVIQEKDGRWRWKSKYYLRSRQDLFSLFVRSNPDGILEKDLLESYKGVDEDIKVLKRKDLVYVVGSGMRTVLYLRDTRLELKVSAEVIEEYNSVKLPHAIEVHKYLVDNGLKDSDDTAGITIAKNVVRKRPKRQTKRKARKVKLTNTHMAGSGIDLNQDFKPAKDSAFS